MTPKANHRSIVWLTVTEAARHASVSKKTVKRWILSGALLAVRLPSPKGKGHLRVRLNDLEALLARGSLSGAF
jgi:excisionase family DNA binding protein